MEVSRILNYIVAKTGFTGYEPGLREWHLRSEENEHATRSDMGILSVLPPEVRYIIYDMCCWQGTVFRVTAGPGMLGVGFPGRSFRLPAIAHVCYEMRQEVLRKYEMISFTFQIQGPLCEKDSPSDAIWTEGRFKGAVAIKVGFVQAHDVVVVNDRVTRGHDDELRIVLDHML